MLNLLEYHTVEVLRTCRTFVGPACDKSLRDRTEKSFPLYKAIKMTYAFRVTCVKQTEQCHQRY